MAPGMVLGWLRMNDKRGCNPLVAPISLPIGALL